MLPFLDYINEVLQESENENERPTKEDWETGITFTARTPREFCLNILLFQILFVWVMVLLD